MASFATPTLRPNRFPGLRLPQIHVPPAGVGEAVLSAESARLYVRCRLGDGPWLLSGGVGGWNTLSREGREDAYEYGSTPATEMTGAIIFDGLRHRASVEDDIAMLRRLATAPPGSPRGTRPPILKVTGSVPHGGHRWVILDITEDNTIWHRMTIVRYEATVKLGKYEPVGVITIRRPSAAPATKPYRVKKGDTLAKIAKSQMGAKTSKDIAKGVARLKALNKIRDSKALTKLVGKTIKVPR